MTAHRTTTGRRVAGLLGATLAAAAMAAPAPADARDVPPELYQAEIPEGVVEHGIVAFTIEGSPAASDRRIEYWATNERWRSVTRETATGEQIAEAFGTETSTTYFNTVRYGPGQRRERGSWLSTMNRRSTPPLAGWTPAYNRKLVQNGVLAPFAPVTIAGIQGTLYTVPQERKTTDPDVADRERRWVTDDTQSKTSIALEDGTFAPLRRETVREDNGEYGRFVQREELVLRERTPDASGLESRLGQAVERRVLRKWRSKARAFAAKAKRAKARKRA